MITYDIDSQQPKRSKKGILEAKAQLLLSVLIALILILLILAFYLIFHVEGV
ncbi:hypothetical protein KVK81_03330 [Helicobacter pylori]|nr:hypothetical protein KVK81_03330 [Helicobacter pylori]